MNDAPAPVVEVLRAYADCVLRKDAAGFAALYDLDVEVFDAWDAWRLQGRAAVQAMASGWFQSLGDNRVEVTFSQVRGHASAEVAAVSALVTYTAVAGDGTTLRSQANRMSLVLRCQPEGWRVVHEHTSVPVGFASRQAIPP
jgi:uncharacterized protein (TIGR02246 family)